jgi:hypothetical protein
MQSQLNAGNYKGLWIDDVNTNFSVGDANGNFVAPIDSATGAPMTWDAWRAYVAQFLTQVRQSFPGREIVHNSVWYAGPDGVRDQDPSIQKQISQSDIIVVERGIGSDTGLTGGTGVWSLNALFAYIDRVHQLGKSVIMLQYDVTDLPTLQYSLAGYYLISGGGDYYGDTVTNPTNWWNGFNTDLGAPLGPRTYNNGVYQRNFANGVVLLVDPGMGSVTINLPATFKTLDGTSVNSVTLSGRQGIVLTGAYPGAAPALSLSTGSLAAGTVGMAYNAPLAATGGSGSYTYSISGAPAGLAVSGSSITGTPTAAGNFNPVVTVRDSNGASAQKTLALSINSAAAISTSSLPNAVVGRAYSATLAATSGSGSYTWSATGLPAGVSVNGSTLTGTPTAAGTANVTLTMTDTVTKLTSQKALTLAVYSAPAISTASLPAGTVGTAYSAALTGTGGSGNYSWAATGLPAGLAINGATIAGTPTAAATSSVSIIITDTVTGVTAQNTLPVSIAAAPAAAQKVHYMSDLPAYNVFQSWGTLQMDKSIEGTTLSLNGVKYAKGLGAHAYSEASYNTNGACSTFTATIGIDDEIPAPYGSLYFQVWGDGILLYSGPTMHGGDKAINISVNVSGRQSVGLVVTNGIFKAASWQVPDDHADWANAKMTCTW